jgi:RNA polymerase sigma-70 factor (ECF subfamily)
MSEFDSQIRESSGHVRQLAYSILRNREDAEDVAQAAFLKAYGELHTLRDHERFRPWIARITWRLALNHRRANLGRQRRAAAFEESRLPCSALVRVIEQERSRLLWRAIEALPEKFRTVVILAYIEGHDLAHVCRELNIPKGTAKSRLLRARNRLRMLLEPKEA